MKVEHKIRRFEESGSGKKANGGWEETFGEG